MYVTSSFTGPLFESNRVIHLQNDLERINAHTTLLLSEIFLLNDGSMIHYSYTTRRTIENHIQIGFIFNDEDNKIVRQAIRNINKTLNEERALFVKQNKGDKERIEEIKDFYRSLNWMCVKC